MKNEGLFRSFWRNPSHCNSCLACLSLIEYFQSEIVSYVLVNTILIEDWMYFISVHRIVSTEFIMVICLPIGSLFSGVVVDYFGRKRSLMAVNIPLAIVWLLLYFAINPVMLFTSAILTGFCIGLHGAAAEAYSGEICQPNYRGTISASVGNTLLV